MKFGGVGFFPFSQPPHYYLLGFNVCLMSQEKNIHIPLRVKLLLPLQKRRKMQKPNGDVTVKPKPIQGTGSTNG